MYEDINDSGDLKLRIENLERRMRIVVRTGFLSLGCVILMSIMGLTSAPERTLVAEKFILRDSAGNKRAVLDVEGNGPSLALYDEKDRVRAALSVGPDGTPLLALADSKGEARIHLSLAVGNAPYLEFYNGDAKPRVTLSLDYDDQVRLFLYDKAKNGYWSAFGSAPLADKSGHRN